MENNKGMNDICLSYDEMKHMVEAIQLKKNLNAIFHFEKFNNLNYFNIFILNYK